jgi:hypothetical protein
MKVSAKMNRRIICLVWIAVIGGLASPGSAQLFERTDPQREVELGRQVARQIEREVPLSRDRPMQERVQRIGHALVESLPQKAYPYEFKVLAVPDFNAFALPGGFIFINEGLLARLQNDNAVAFVMAHEIAHASHRHWHHLMERMKGISLVGILVGVGTGNAYVASLAHTLISMKYSRAHEEEADTAGLEYLWAAGFDPNGAIEAAQVIAKLDTGKGRPPYLRSHPRGTDRLKRITALCGTLKTRPRPGPPAGDSAPPALAIDLSALVGRLPEGQPGPNPWFPLAVGNTWTYAVTEGGGHAVYLLRVVSAIRQGSGAIYRAETAFGKGDPIPCQLLTTATGFWRRNRPAASSSPWELEFPFGLSEDTPIEPDGKTYTVLKPEPITVPCGHFDDVLKMRQQSGSNRCDLWFARGIGLVKRVCVETGVAETLVSYWVEGAPK